jgi:hypothetical protein
MKLVNAVAILVIAACAVVAVFVLKSPEPAPPSHASDFGGHGDEVRKIASEVVAYQPGSAAHTQHPPPFDPLATARVGDWRASRLVNDGTLVRDNKIGPITAHAIHTVTAAGDTTVTIATRGIIDSPAGLEDPAGSASPDELPRHGATFEQLILSAWAIPSFAVEDDTRTLGGHAFHCKKVTYRQIDPMLPRKTVDVELWLSLEVAVDGFVARHEVQTLDKLVFTMDEELVGFGAGSAATWGERPRGL